MRIDRTSRSSLICSDSPPIPAKLAFPGSSTDMLYTSGSTSRGKILMMVKVVISSATRVPAFSLSFGTLFRQPTMYRGPEAALTMTREQVPLSFDGQISCGRAPTSFIVQLFQHFPDDLSNALKRLDIFLRFIVILFESTQTQSNWQSRQDAFQARFDASATHAL